MILLSEAVFFDRDGVLNKLIGPGLSRGPRAVEELEFIENAHKLVSKLVNLGFHCEIISNQPDFARGLLSAKVHHQIVEIYRREIPSIANQRYCLHDNFDMCKCRKPKTQLLVDACTDFGIDPAGSWFIGDSWTDVLASHRFGCKSILIENKNSWKPTSQGTPPINLKPDFTAIDLESAVSFITQIN